MDGLLNMIDGNANMRHIITPVTAYRVFHYRSECFSSFCFDCETVVNECMHVSLIILSRDFNSTIFLGVMKLLHFHAFSK